MGNEIKLTIMMMGFAWFWVFISGYILVLMLNSIQARKFF